MWCTTQQVTMNLFNLGILLQVWCSLVPLSAAEAPEPDPSAPPDLNPSPSPIPAPVPQPLPVPDLTQPAELLVIPVFLQWVGAISGVLGLISFTHTYVQKLIDAFTSVSQGSKPPAKHDKAWFESFEAYHRKLSPSAKGWKTRVAPKKKGDPSWKVGIQVGLDGGGLQVK